MARVKTLIMGAAGRDFHNFNVVYKNDPNTEVVAFTGTQIPGISGRKYPAELAGPLYPEGISIIDESWLETLVRKDEIGRVVFSYSDISHETVMHAASKALAAGADFILLGPESTMLRSSKPVIAVSAVRTGCGKSQTARWISGRLKSHGLMAGILRHPMPYGHLASQRLQRFATLSDLSEAHCTNEEREEYEPHIAAGNVVFAGVDYAAILTAAESESDVILWDGGNNDFPFIKPDLHIVITDALRPDHLSTHHPGEATLRMADIVVINKVNSASAEVVQRMIGDVHALNPRATIVRASSPVKLENPDAVRGKRVLVIDDGPTITHGGMAHGAGNVAALEGGAAEIVDPRASATDEILEVYNRYPHIGRVLPAVGYSDAELMALQQTINQSDAEVILSASPFNLSALIQIDKPFVRARYDFEEAGEPTLGSLLDDFLTRIKAKTE